MRGRLRSQPRKAENGDQLPPHAPDAEAAVLGSLITDGNGYIEAAEWIKAAEWFYDLRHQVIWQAMARLFGESKAIDLVMVTEALRATGRLDEIGGVQYLTKISGEIPSTANLPAWLEQMDEKKVQRDLLRDTTEIQIEIRQGERPVAEIVTTAQARILEVGQRESTYAEVGMGAMLAQVEQILEDYHLGRKVMSGYSTGFNYLDNVIAGLELGQMYVIGGRPGTGKTSLGMDMTLHFARTHGPVAFFSLEMTVLQLTLRAVASMARVSFQKFRNGFKYDTWTERMAEAAMKLANLPLWVDATSGLNGQEILLRSRRMMQQRGIKLVVIDYLQLMGAVQRWQQRREQVAEASEWCKRIARDLNVPVLVLAQLNRDVDKERRKRAGPQLADLAESGDIEQDADCVMALNPIPTNDEMVSPKLTLADAKLQVARMQDKDALRHWYWVSYADSESPEDRERGWGEYLRRTDLVVLKQRNGPSEVNVELVYAKEQMRFMDAGRPRAGRREEG